MSPISPYFGLSASRGSGPDLAPKSSAVFYLLEQVMSVKKDGNRIKKAAKKEKGNGCHVLVA